MPEHQRAMAKRAGRKYDHWKDGFAFACGGCPD